MQQFFVRIANVIPAGWEIVDNVLEQIIGRLNDWRGRVVLVIRFVYSLRKWN